MAAAQSASTSSNLQQWSLVAVTDPELKAQVRKLSAGDSGLANGYIEEAPAILLWVADLSRNHDMTVADGLNPGVHEYLDSFVMATVDASLASQNATVAAESIGLGTVYIVLHETRQKNWPNLFNCPRTATLYADWLSDGPIRKATQVFAHACLRAWSLTITATTHLTLTHMLKAMKKRSMRFVKDWE